MRCLHCGKALPLLKRLSGGEFCSDAHRRKYQQEFSQLALSRLQHTQIPAMADSQRNPPQAPSTVNVAGPAAGARPTLATAPTLAAAPTPRAEMQNGLARVSPPARVAEPLSPTRKTPPPASRPQPRPQAPPKQETAAPASMAGRLTHKPPIAGMRVAAMIAPGDQMFVTAAVPNLPRREVPRVSAGLVHASVVNWDPACDIRESATHAVEARVELRSFVRLAPVVDCGTLLSGPRTLHLANEAVDMPVADCVSPDAAALWPAPPCDFSGSTTALGVALDQLGRLDEAVEFYEKLLLASPHSVDLLSNLISLSMVRKDEVRVKELAERLLKIQPESRQALEGLAGVALSRGDYSTAVHHCSRLVKVAATSYEGWFNLGVAYQKVGRLEQAVGAYREAVRLRPDSAGADANLGAALQERGDLDGARAACQRALDASPQLPGALWNLAIATERQGNVQEAEKLFEKLVAVQPDWEDAAFRLGYLQFQRAEYAAAVGSFEICLKKRQDWTDALFNLGLASWKFEDLETAASAFRRVLSLDPENSAAMGCLAAVLVDQKNSGEALDWYRKLKARDQPAPELSYNLGLLLQLAGDHAAAAECYQAAVDGKPEFSQALLNLGHALRAAGKEDEAQQAWSRAVAADPQLAGQYFQ